MNKADLEELPGDTEDALEIDVAARVEEVFDSVMEQKS
jgi:ATP-dependent Lon protease